MTYIMLIFGFGLLIKGADIFVSGAGSVAKKFNISNLIIGLTVVAFGTSAPELAVSTLASLSGQNEIAISNVVGSNIFNILGVLGICAIISPIKVKSNILKKEIPMSLGITVLLLLLLFEGLNFTSGNYGLSRIDTLILLVFFAGFMWYIYKSSKVQGEEEAEADDIAEIATSKSIVFIILGLAAVVYGGSLVVDNATKIAESLGVSETVIGLTIVAIGTSLPELVTSIIACKKGSTDMAIGNVIGSNIFNILFILGVSGTISPLTIDVLAMYDTVVVIFVTILAYVVSRSNREISRVEGIGMISLFVGYTYYILVR